MIHLTYWGPRPIFRGELPFEGINFQVFRVECRRRKVGILVVGWMDVELGSWGGKDPPFWGAWKNMKMTRLRAGKCSLNFTMIFVPE